MFLIYLKVYSSNKKPENKLATPSLFNQHNFYWLKKQEDRKEKINDKFLTLTMLTLNMQTNIDIL